MTSSREYRQRVDREVLATSDETFELVTWLANDERRMWEVMPPLSPITKQRLGAEDEHAGQDMFVLKLSQLIDIEDENLRQAAYCYLCGYSDDDLAAMFESSHIVGDIETIFANEKNKDSMMHDAVVVPIRDRRLPRKPKTQSTAERPATTHKNLSSAALEDSLGLYLREIGKVELLNAAQEVELAKDIEAGLYATHLLETQSKITPERRRELGQMAVVGAQAKEHMISANMRLAVNVARKSAYRSSLPMLDHIQDANMGLIRAVEKFDYTKGFKFSTYAMWWLRQAIARERTEQERTIRVPVHVVEKINKMRRVVQEYNSTHGKDPDEVWLSGKLNVSVKKLHELREASRDTISLNKLVGSDEDSELLDFIGEEADPTADTAIAHEKSEQANNMLGILNARQRFIAERRFGFYDGTEWTYDAIGRELKLSREMIRRIIEDKIIPNLRREVASHGAPDSIS